MDQWLVVDGCVFTVRAYELAEERSKDHEGLLSKLVHTVLLTYRDKPPHHKGSSIELHWEIITIISVEQKKKCLYVMFMCPIQFSVFKKSV